MTNDTGRKPVVSHKKHIARLQRERQQSRLILYTFFGILGVVVLLLGYGWLDLNYLQLQRPVAKIGDTNILVKDFEPRVRLQRQQLLNDFNTYLQYQQFFGMNMDAQLQQIEFTLNSPSVLGQSVLDQMIDEEIIRQEAAKRGITVSEEEITAEIEAAFGYFPDGTPTPTLTPEGLDTPEIPEEAFSVVTVTPLAGVTSLPSTPTTAPTQPAASASEDGETQPAPTATLAPTSTATLESTPTPGPTSTPLPTATPYTYEAFEKTIEETSKNLGRLGFDEEYYRDFFEVQILSRKLKEALAAGVPVTETQVWARHILVGDPESAEDIIQQLKNGGDFGELAKEFSVDTGSAVNGGDLGWFGTGMMVPEFEAAAFALENPGDYTLEPVQSQFGFHIIQLIARQERPLPADRLETAKETSFQDWLTAIREEYSIETFDIWRQRVPTEPNFITAATEAAIFQLTAQAEALEQFQQTPTP